MHLPPRCNLVLVSRQNSITILFYGKMLLHMLKTGLEVSVLSGLIRENDKEILLTLQTLWRQSVVTGW